MPVVAQVREPDSPRGVRLVRVLVGLSPRGRGATPAASRDEAEEDTLPAPPVGRLFALSGTAHPQGLPVPPEC